MEEKLTAAEKLAEQERQKIDFVMDNRNGLAKQLVPLCRQGMVDELKEKLTPLVSKACEGYLPCEAAIALQMITDFMMTLNFDL